MVCRISIALLHQATPGYTSLHHVSPDYTRLHHGNSPQLGTPDRPHQIRLHQTIPDLVVVVAGAEELGELVAPVHAGDHAVPRPTLVVEIPGEELRV